MADFKLWKESGVRTIITNPQKQKPKTAYDVAVNIACGMTIRSSLQFDLRYYLANLAQVWPLMEKQQKAQIRLLIEKNKKPSQESQKSSIGYM